FGNLYEKNPNGGGAGRKGLMQQLENSLRRLQTDYVDIYWLHNFDPATPVEETMRTLDDLVTSGKVRHIGFSDVPAWRTAEAATLAHFRGWAPIIALQLEYSLLERTSEGELIPLAQAKGVGVLPWSPAQERHAVRQVLQRQHRTGRHNALGHGRHSEPARLRRHRHAQ